MEITVQRALNELKTLDSRLYKRLQDFTIVGSKKNSETRVSETREQVGEFSTNAKAKLDSVQDLLKRQRELKHAIMESNAKTKIVVAGVEYTVMTAIDRKRTIDTEKTVLANMVDSLAKAERKVAMENKRVEEYLERQVLTMASGDLSNKKADFVVAFEKSYRDDNEWQLVDPLELRKLIEKMEKEIEEFELEIDTALTVSNAITTITISE